MLLTYGYISNKFVCREPAASLLSDARYQAMPDDNILSENTVLLVYCFISYFLVDEKLDF